jgi:hypothetical protein
MTEHFSRAAFLLFFGLVLVISSYNFGIRYGQDMTVHIIKEEQRKHETVVDELNASVALLTQEMPERCKPVDVKQEPVVIKSKPKDLPKKLPKKETVGDEPAWGDVWE